MPNLKKFLPPKLLILLGSSSYERIPTEYAGETHAATPLLSSTLLKGEIDEEADLSTARRPRSSWAHRHRRVLISLPVIVIVVLAFAIAKRTVHTSQTPTTDNLGEAITTDGGSSDTASSGPIYSEPPISPPDNAPDAASSGPISNEPPIPPPYDDVPDTTSSPTSHDPPTPNPPLDSVDLEDPVVAAQQAVDALYARQSPTLEHAIARYSLKTGRSPPRNYDKWFKFAQKKSCLIDDYDQIHRDFKPFYQLAEDDPLFFQRMVDIATDMIKDDAKMMTTVVIKDEKMATNMTAEKTTPYWDTWPTTFGQFAAYLPDMTFVINAMDEPRVVFNTREPGARKKALVVTQQTPFDVSPILPQISSEIKVDVLFCGGQKDLRRARMVTVPTQWTVDLFPLLSMTKISPCFSDIVYPIEYYYDRSWWSGKFAYPNNIQWGDKKSQIYWRGTSSGGMIFGSNYHNFTRYKLVRLGQKHTDVIDVEMTSFADELCGSECDKEKIVEEYNITGHGVPREDEYKYKYLLDVDGMSFSGRFLGLLRSGSLVFKATVFTEYFSDWLRPYEHYIPVLPDLSDLVEKIEWAKTHDAEARMIQERGRQMVERVMTDGQNDCYFFAVLLEWAQLQEISRKATMRGES
ncbi:glycosyl transferase family 90-domain-containing protein [Mycena sp. CBHHK59/15]|nr:glycosyl transferase family 90-domain-containing protein [Mycena sp. CBHHK59/15]